MRVCSSRSRLVVIPVQISGSGWQVLQLAGVNIASNRMVLLASLVDIAFLGN
jgi:hypothetical protein